MLPAGVTLASGDQITATATIAAYGTSEIGANATLRTISGKVFEDKGSDQLASGQVIGDANNPGVSGATIRLYKDGGDGVANGTMMC